MSGDERDGDERWSARKKCTGVNGNVRTFIVAGRSGVKFVWGEAASAVAYVTNRRNSATKSSEMVFIRFGRPINVLVYYIWLFMDGQSIVDYAYIIMSNFLKRRHVSEYNIEKQFYHVELYNIVVFRSEKCQSWFNFIIVIWY